MRIHPTIHLKFNNHNFVNENIMKEQLENRLTELKAEQESGQKVLADLEAKQASLQNTLLRIAGAIQVLEEEIAKTENSQPSASEPVETS